MIGVIRRFTVRIPVILVTLDAVRLVKHPDIGESRCVSLPAGFASPDDRSRHVTIALQRITLV